MAVSDDALVTYANMATYLGSASGDQTKIENLIDAASFMAKSYCDRVLKAQALTEYYDGDNSTILVTRNYPINAVTTLHIDVDRSYGSSTLIAAADYVSYKGEGIISLDSDVFTADAQSVKLVYNAGYGYSTDSVPWDLQQSIKELCAYMWQRQKENRVGVKSQNWGDQGISYEIDAVPKSVKGVWDMYRKRVVRVSM